LLRHTDGFISAAAHILVMSLVLECITIGLPIGFQIVLDDVVVSNDGNLLTLVVIGFALLVAFRALTEFVRSWTIMSATANLTLQWKAALFYQMMPLAVELLRAASRGRSRLALQLDRYNSENTRNDIDGAGRWRRGDNPSAHDVYVQFIFGDACCRYGWDIRRDPQRRISAL
jgi:hypothetical protein